MLKCDIWTHPKIKFHEPPCFQRIRNDRKYAKPSPEVLSQWFSFHNKLSVSKFHLNNFHFQNLFFSQINLITTHDIFCIWGGFFHSDWKFISLLNLFVRIIWNSIFRIYFVFIQALSSFQIKDFNKNRKQISLSDSFEIWEYAIFYWQFGIVDTIKFVT